MFVPRYTEDEARAAVGASISYSEVLRRLGLRPAGGNHKVLRHYVDDVWRISTDHFDPDAGRGRGGHAAAPLEELLVQGSTYSRGSLKRRLYAAGLKPRRCELCGQDENWHGGRMALVLDHINGVPDDNRLENLRIVCPNCAATFETHCGRKNQVTLQERRCARCSATFVPRTPTQRYCSHACGTRHANRRRGPQPDARKVVRPSYEQLVRDLAESNFSAVGRRYGVSDNAVRKWLRTYEREAWEDREGGARNQKS
jgi:ferredoxin